MTRILAWWQHRRERAAWARRVRLRVEQEEQLYYWRRMFADKRERERTQ